MSNYGGWIRVPDNSTLEMWMDPGSHGEEYPWTSRVRILDDQGNERIYDDHELTPGPAVHTIHQPRVYSGRLRVVFAAEGRGVFHARIVKPDGSVFGNPFTMVLEGGAGDVVRGTLNIVTLRS